MSVLPPAAGRAWQAVDQKKTTRAGGPASSRGPIAIEVTLRVTDSHHAQQLLTKPYGGLAENQQITA